MKCYHCGGKLLCVRSEQKGNDRHRWYRCYDCSKTIHTVEKWVKRGPPTGSKRPTTSAAAYGERNAASVFTNADILKMREMAARGILQKEIAVIFGIWPSSVSRIVNRKAWKHI